MDDLKKAGATALSQAYLHSKKEELKEAFDVEGQNLIGDEFDDEPTTTDENGVFWTADTLWTSGVLIAAAGTIGVNILVMVVYGGALTVAAGSIASVVAVGVAVNELQIEDLDSLRKVQNALRQDVNKFADENGRLGKNVDELKVKVFCFKETEQRLKDVTDDQNLNVNALVKLVHESQRIIDEKKKIILHGIEVDLMNILLKADRDDSGSYSQSEIKRLVIYLRGLPAVEVNEGLLTEALKNENCIVSIMNLVRDISKAGNQEGDHIFVIDTENEELHRRVLEKV